MSDVFLQTHFHGDLYCVCRMRQRYLISVLLRPCGENCHCRTRRFNFDDDRANSGGLFRNCVQYGRRKTVIGAEENFVFDCQSAKFRTSHDPQPVFYSFSARRSQNRMRPAGIRFGGIGANSVFVRRANHFWESLISTRCNRSIQTSGKKKKNNINNLFEETRAESSPPGCTRQCAAVILSMIARRSLDKSFRLAIFSFSVRRYNSVTQLPTEI